MPENLPGTLEAAHAKAARSTYMGFTLRRHRLGVGTSELHVVKPDHFRAGRSVI